MPISIEAEIRSRVEAFAVELVELVKASAMDVVNEALGGGRVRGGRRTINRRASGRAPSRPKGAKRDPKVLAELTSKLDAFIRKDPGKRIEEIGKALGTPTKELVLPVKKLIAAKKISTKGQRRSTRYHPR
jgi:hypothetical protein